MSRGGEAYRDGKALPDADLAMSIVEYEVRGRATQVAQAGRPSEPETLYSANTGLLVRKVESRTGAHEASCVLDRAAGRSGGTVIR